MDLIPQVISKLCLTDFDTTFELMKGEKTRINEIYQSKSKQILYKHSLKERLKIIKNLLDVISMIIIKFSNAKFPDVNYSIIWEI